MPAHFEISQYTDGQFYFNLRTEDNDVIFISEGYPTKASAENGIDTVRENAPLEARYVRDLSPSEQPYFVLKASNGEVLGRSHLYTSPGAMERGIARLKAAAPTAGICHAA